MELTTAPKLLHLESGQIRPTTGEGGQPFQGGPCAGPGTAGLPGEGAPPDSNTGAQNTEGEKAAVNIDWWQGTFKGLSLMEVIDLFSREGLGASGWEGLPNGRYGYKLGVVRGAVRVYCEGTEEMGIHVVCSGEGVRQLETEGIVARWDGPEGFAAVCGARGFKPSRIDVAIDDREGLVTQERVEASIGEGGCVSRFDRGHPRQDVNLSDGSLGGWSFRFGSGKSDAGVRIYDKAKEQGEKGKQVEGHWMRVELQLRNERAAELMGLLMQDGCELGKLAAGRLWAYLDFRVVDGTDTNKSRWACCAWWAAFVGNVEKVIWKGATVTQSLEKTARWFLKQVAPSYALLRFSAEHGAEWLDEVFANGAVRVPVWMMATLSNQRPQAVASS